MQLTNTVRGGIAAAALTAAMAVPSFADLSPINTGVTPSGSNQLFTYRADFAVGSNLDHQLNSGDFFTLYDIRGLNTSSITSATDFTSSVQFVGVTPANVAPPDSASIDNITYTYNGPTLTADQSFNGFGFTSTSPYSSQLGFFASRDQKELSGGTGFTDEGHVGNVLVPSDVPATTTTPEPGTVASFAFGAFGLFGLAFTKRRKSVKTA